MLRKQSLNNPKPPKKRNGFFWMGIVSIIFSSTLFAILIVTGKHSFILTQWYHFLIPIPAFFGGQLSGCSYIGRTGDLISEKGHRTFEKWGTFLGAALGLAIGVGLVVSKTALNTLTGGITDAAIVILNAAASVIGSIGSFGSLGYRAGSAILKPDNNFVKTFFAKIFNKDKKGIILGAIMGLGTSLALWFSGNAALTVVIGVTSFFTGGAAVPFWIAGGIFVLSYTGTNIASFDHFSRSFTFIKATLFNDESASKEVEGRFHEYRGSTLGVTVGLILATAIITTVLITQPYITAMIGAIAVTIVCTNALGGLFARLAVYMDHYKTPTVSEKPLTQLNIQSEISARPAHIANLLNEPEIPVSSLRAQPSVLIADYHERDKISAKALISRRKPIEKSPLLETNKSVFLNRLRA